MPYLAIAAGAVLGASTRHLITIIALERFGAGFPYGTLFINVSGSFAIGLFLTLIAERLTFSPYWRLFVATGFLGSYTTFSAYTFETARLLEHGAFGAALLYLLGSVAAGMIGVFLGIVVAEAL